MSPQPSVLSCVSWNIHRGRGEDGIVDPARTADVLCDEVCITGTEVLLLQEADEECPPHRGVLPIERIEARTGLRSVHADPASRWGAESHGFLGLICFLHPSLELEAISVVDLPGHCHRGAVVLDLLKQGDPLRMVAMHLSLTQVLRIVQLRTLAQNLFRRAPRPTVLCGDLNEWRPWGGIALSPRVLGAGFSGPALPTFPVRRPFLPLDRFLAAQGARVAEAEVLDGPGIRMASDHRPLAVRIALDAGG